MSGIFDNSHRRPGAPMIYENFYLSLPPWIPNPASLIVPDHDAIQRILHAWDQYTPLEGGILVTIDVEKVDRDWNPNYKIAIDGSSAYRRKRREICEGDAQSMIPPDMYVDDDNQVMFSNGRHRFANIRDLGVRQISVTIDIEYLQKIQLYLVSASGGS
jgi:hypothetical protein